MTVMITFQGGKVIILNLSDKSIKWKYFGADEIVAAYWVEHPSKVVLVQNGDIKYLNLYFNYVKKEAHGAVESS
jgi:hypothetical protein